MKSSNVPEAVSIKSLRKSYGQHEVLRGIDLTANDGDVISIIGASGSGKSTLLRCIPMLEVPNYGEVAVGDDRLMYLGKKLSKSEANTVRRIRRNLGFVFQSFNLWPHRTVLQNVIEAPLHVQGRRRSEAIEEAMVLLEKVGLADKRFAGRIIFPEVSSNVSRLHVRWLSARVRYCSTSRRLHWILSWWETCFGSFVDLPKKAVP